jgi:hypothetical protein
VAEALAPASAGIGGDLALPAAMLLLGVILVASFAVATGRLRSWEIKGAD